MTLATDQLALYLITGWDIFPSSENTKLLDLIRRGCAESRAIHESPGHFFSLQDELLLNGLLSLSLYSPWDAILTNEAAEYAVEFSNDEFIDISCVDKFSDRFREIENWMAC